MRVLFTFIFALIINASLFAGSGVFEYYLNTSLNGSGTFSGNSSSFDGKDLGPITSGSNTLEMTLTGCKTYQNSGDDIYAASMYYRVYKDDGTPGGFNAHSLSYFDQSGGDKEWQNNGTIDLLNGITAIGTYIVEIYYEANGNNNGTLFNIYENNNGANLKAEFTVNIVLPVRLTTFSATPEARKIALTWTTSSEENNAGFEVQKSIDGEHFETIETIEGNGTSIEVNTYDFIDENPISGENYYRLKQNDFDGNFEYSDILIVQFDNEVKASIFPNPTTEKLVVTTELQEEMNIRIFNMNGQLVYQNAKRVENQVEINLENLAKGNYILQVTNTNDQSIIYNGTFVKQ